MHDTTLKTLVREFLEHIEKRGCSTKTVENYNHYLARFLSNTHIDAPGDITKSVIDAYRTLLNGHGFEFSARDGKQKKLTQKTQNYHLTALRTFLKYLHDRHITSLDSKKVRLSRVEQMNRTVGNVTDIPRILSAMQGGSLKDLRDNAILHVLASTGVRISELCSLNTDSNLSHEKLTICTKNNRVRTVPIPLETAHVLKKYLDARADSNKALFINISKHTGSTGDSRLTPRSVQRIVRCCALKAGVTHAITPHSIRHTFATALLKHDKDLDSARTALGHARVVTTKRYAPHTKSAHSRVNHSKKRHVS